MELAKLRDQINRIDHELIKLLNERARIALEIGSVKRASGQPILDEQRENYVINRVIKINSGPMPEKSMNKIFSEIVMACREIQDQQQFLA